MLNIPMEFLLNEDIDYEEKLWGEDMENRTPQNMEIKIRYEAK